MEKTCNKCGLTKPVSEYHKAARNSDGRFHTCKECRKKYDFLYYKISNKKEKCLEYKTKGREKLKEYKSQLRCKYCGESEPVVLDFHHKDQNKEYNIANKVVAYSWERLLVEIKKCEVVCANCHRKLHAGILNVLYIEQ